VGGGGKEWFERRESIWGLTKTTSDVERAVEGLK